VSNDIRIPSLQYKSFIEDLLNIDTNSQQFSVGRAKAAKYTLIHPIVAHSISMSRTSLQLIKEGNLFAAMALARIAFEHAVVAQYAHLMPSGLDGIRAKTYSDYKVNLEAAKEIYPIPQAVLDNFEEMPEMFRPSELRSFKNTCDLFNESKSLYAIYVFMSAPIHPGNKTQNAYLYYENEDQLMPTATLQMGVVESDETILHTLLVSLLLSQFVYEDIRKSKPYMFKIKQISKNSGIPYALTIRSN
jgi:hypothetical protein